MRGHLTERRPGVWRIVVSDRFTEAGKRVRHTKTVNGTKRTAERALTAMLRELDEGRLAKGRQPLSRYLSTEWLPAVAKVSKRGRPLAPTTRQRYSDAVRHVNKHIGKVRLSDLRPAHIERCRDGLLSEGLSPQTTSDILRVLTQALSRAEALEYVGRNPAAPELVHRPTGEPSSFAVIDAALGGRILDAAVGEDPWDAAVHLALGLGLRREEVLGLAWEHVEDGIVRVRRTLTAASGDLHFGPPKSKAGRRNLPMPMFVAEALHRHRLAQGERALSLGLPRPELVVCNAIGEPLQPASFSKAWKAWANSNGFTGIGFHGLRHGAATLLLAAGVPDTVAMRTMGHADTRILARYQDVVSELQREAASRMDDLLAPKVSPADRR
jgi:integrase